MKKKFVLISSSLILATLAFGLASFRHVEKSEASVGNYSTNAATYYNGITATSGKQLAAQLHDLITSTHRTYTNYADNGANEYQINTDQYYENGSKVSGYIYEFYTGVKWPAPWYPTAGDTRGGYNREHCWCQSNSVNASGTQMWGETGGGADMHHLRPVEVRLNSTRNNNVYGEISNRDSNKVYAKSGTNTTYAHGGYLANSVFEPLDSKKGDVARIILYTYLHYNSYSVSTLFGSYGTTNGNGNSSYFSSSLLSLKKTTNQTTEAAALAMLLEWNDSDPVDDIETRRNEQVAKYQGNRNPFIDNSNYANMIWGSGSPTPTVKSVSVSPTTLNLDLNGTTTGNLTATVTVSNGAAQTVTWTSSNTNVATVSSGGVVTAVGKGTCAVTATSTVNSNKSASCTVKVADTSGGTQTITGSHTWNLTIASYNNDASENLVTWEDDCATMESIRTDSKRNKANGYLGGDSNNRSSSRFYTGNTLSITPSDGYTITSIEFTATSDSYATTLGNSTWDNASASVSSSTVTVTPTDGTEVISALIGGTCGFSAVKVNYSTETVGSVSVLSSISLNTSNVQLEFYVGDAFDYSGLIVTAYYEDGTEDIVEPSSVSTPNMSTTRWKTITVTYEENGVTATAEYQIHVLSNSISAIYASTTKTYHPGETISKSDIFVEDNLGNEITDFEFANDGYRFTYVDAPSGGSDGTKTFAGSVTYSSYSTDLVVSTNRINYVTPVYYHDIMNKSWTGNTGASYIDWSGKSGSSGATYAGSSGGTYGSIQIKKEDNATGIVTTAYSGSLSITSVTVKWNSNTLDSRTLNIYGDTTAYTSPTEIFGNSPKGTLLGSITKSSGNSLTISGQYQFIGMRSTSGAIYLDEIDVMYGIDETPTNVANYIMYADTTNQCTTKFDVAKGYFNNLTAAEKTTFMTSDDYVIATARERFEAWARNQGKTITLVNGTYTISNAKYLGIEVLSSSFHNSTLIVVIVSFMSVTMLVAYLYRRKKKNG